MRSRSPLIAGHRQEEISLDPAGKYSASSRPQPASADCAGPADAVEQRVAVLSAGLLRAGLTISGEDRAGLAARAGVDASVVAEALSGACPAWALPYDQFTALAGATTVWWPRAAFEAAAACDLLLTCILNGDQSMATDVLTEPRTRQFARALLRLALASEPGSADGPAEHGLLTQDQLELLTERATALAGSGSPDAWVGLEILAASTSRQS